MHMNKITIIKIGLAGAAWNVTSLLFVAIIGQIRIPQFGRLVMIMMQKYAPLGFNMKLNGVLVGLFWAAIIGFIQFAFMAYIYKIVTSKRFVEKFIKNSEE